jgi:hypothetical protein
VNANLGCFCVFLNTDVIRDDLPQDRAGLENAIIHFLANVTKATKQPNRVRLEDFRLFLRFFGPVREPSLTAPAPVLLLTHLSP